MKKLPINHEVKCPLCGEVHTCSHEDGKPFRDKDLLECALSIVEFHSGSGEVNDAGNPIVCINEKDLDAIRLSLRLVNSRWWNRGNQ